MRKRPRSNKHADFGAAHVTEEQASNTKEQKKKRWGFYSMFVLLVALILVCSVGLGVLVMGALFVAGIFVPERGNPLPFLILIMLPSIAIGLFATAAFGRKAVRPLTELSEGMKEVASGNFDVRLNESGIGQFKEVNRNFNHMAAELASIELLRDDFIVTVSHEYKSPLSSITGYATLLQDPSLSQEERVEYLEAIMSATRTLSNMSSNTLMLSNLETQASEVPMESFLLDEQLRHVLVIVEPLISSDGLELDIELDEVKVCANAELLETVWTNLLSNAIKFTQSPGTISVKLRATELQARVAVEDTGVGMSESELQRIFEKFYQTDESHGTEGNGLGLALCKKIVEMHKGRIWAESKEGEGSTFIVELPLIQ